ncbi:MAG: cyclic nucleotide-binding domain-containing protein [Alphaproteobacteria bacterium]|nr:cyclic nucleotide-binding domain-containing protein [Alphaproteobacteria bacterium]
MHSKDQVKDALAQINLFEGCADETLAAIAKIAVELNLEKGQILYKPGDNAANLYILVDGIVTFISQSGLEFLNVQRVMDRSRVFGWVALVPEHTRRIGTAQCLEESNILSINGDQLLEILDGDTRSGYSVMRRLCTMIASTIDGKQ